MGFLGWILKKLFLLIIILGVLAFFFQDTFLKVALNVAVRIKTNARISIENVDSKIHKGYIRLGGVMLLNPKDFREKRFIEIDLVEFEFEPLSFIKGDFKVNKFFIDIDKIYIVKQKKEGVNLVKIRKKGASSKNKIQSRYIVEDLRIKISSIVHKDLSKRPPKMKSIFLGLEQKYQNVRNLKKILDIILTQEVLKATYSSN
ncbi:MAG: hypothetical protein P9X27_05705 [Candidatus Kaelpia aquatica]|nr:hypothetical protein [Candidatus Kaelpia aquatica]